MVLKSVEKGTSIFRKVKAIPNDNAEIAEKWRSL